MQPNYFERIRNFCRGPRKLFFRDIPKISDEKKNFVQITSRA
jgi:hypothetical protein